VTCTAFSCVQKFEGGNLSSAKINRPVDLRSEINRRGIAIANQSPRPTCSVHAMTFLLEWGFTELCGPGMNNLSEEYLNHMTNVASGRTDDGDFFSYIAAGYDKYGIVTEAEMPYKTSYSFANISVSSDLIAKGQIFTRKGVKLNGHFIKPNDGSVGMTDAQYKEVFLWLHKGIPVAIGRSHSTVIIGLKYDATRPGGGQFIIRNSYGPGTDDHGYFYEDFESVKKSVNDVYVYDWPKQ
jgi:C1A family cysteine protease